MRIYLSASFARRQELRAYASDLVVRRHVVTASWLFNPPLVEDDGLRMAGTPDQKRAIALSDIEDVAACGVFVAFAEPPDSPYTRGGRFVETGIAIGLGKELWLVGEAENVFAFVFDRVFTDWLDCRAYLDTLTPALAAERA